MYRRAALDIGKTIQDKAPTAAVGLARLKEVKDYIKQTVAAAFRKLRDAGDRLTRGAVNQVVSQPLLEKPSRYSRHMWDEAYMRAKRLQVQGQL